MSAGPAEEPIAFLCEQCGRKLLVPASAAGKRGKCPHCGGLFKIPAESQTSLPSQVSRGARETDEAKRHRRATIIKRLVIGGFASAAVVLGLTAVVCYYVFFAPLPRYGDKAFVTIIAVDKNDPDRMLLVGTVSIENGKLTTHLPGTVYIVGTDRVVVEGKAYTYRQILVRNRRSRIVLAPPGALLIVPKDMKILGRLQKAGSLLVPEDSKWPE